MIGENTFIDEVIERKLDEYVGEIDRSLVDQIFESELHLLLALILLEIDETDETKALQDKNTEASYRVIRDEVNDTNKFVKVELDFETEVIEVSADDYIEYAAAAPTSDSQILEFDPSNEYVSRPLETTTIWYRKSSKASTNPTVKIVLQ